MQPMFDAQSATENLLKRETVRNVLAARGALEYWSTFSDNFFGARHLFGDGSAFFRSCIRKLLKGATKTAELQVLNEAVEIEPEFQPVRLKICDAIPSSYMPSKTPPQVKSLVAVYLTSDRRDELGLSDSFSSFEPLIARVVRVIDDESFECSWLESQPVKGEVLLDGLPDGYNGRWQEWFPPHEDDPSTTVIRMSDIYAANFKLFPGSHKMCGPLKATLKAALSAVKALGEARSYDEIDATITRELHRLSL